MTKLPMAEKSEFYQPWKRYGHCAVVLENEVFLWGGRRHRVNTHEAETEMRSYVDVFTRAEGRWQQRCTHGTPPLGLVWCASCYMSKNIYIFGGESYNYFCYNSVHALNTDNLNWRELFSSTNRSGPMKKGYCGMIAIEDNLLIVGGYGKSPYIPQPTAEYEIDEDYVRTNEHHLFNTGEIEWLVPSVSGDIPPPNCDFTLTKYSSDKAVMFGGVTPKNNYTSDVRVATIGQNNVHWEKLPIGRLDRPRPRYHHAATCITCPLMGQQRAQLLVVGGGPLNDECWLLDLDRAMWREVNNIPDYVMKRNSHTISAVAVSDACVWIIAVGGLSPQLPKYPGVALFELSLSPTGLWELGFVCQNMDTCKAYQNVFSIKFPSSHQTVSQEQIELQEQFIRINMEHSQLTLLLKERDEELQMVKKTSQAKEKENLQLKSKVNSNEEELHSVKKISRAKDAEITQLESKLMENVDQLAAKEFLLLEKQAKLTASEEARSEQAKIIRLSEKTFQENCKLKEILERREMQTNTRDIHTQANYLALVGNSVQGVEECGETVLEITGNKHQKLFWEDYGFHLTVPDGAVCEDVTVHVAVKAILAGQFHFPNDAHLVSAIYWISASEMFHKKITVNIHHCAIISSEEEALKYKFIVGKCSQKSLPYTFKILDGVFTPNSQLATISVKQFSFLAAIFQGWWGDNKCRYTSHCYLRHDRDRPTSWDFMFILTPKSPPWDQLVQKKYNDWKLHHPPTEVEFEVREQSGTQKQSISLDITTAKEEEPKVWDICAVNAKEISKQSVDKSTKTIGTDLHCCQLAIDWKGQSGIVLPVLKRRVNLVGAKAPNNFFTLCIRPPQSPASSTTSEEASTSRSKKRSTSQGDLESTSKRVCPENRLENTVILETGLTVGDSDANVPSNTTSHNFAPSNVFLSTPLGQMPILDRLPEGILGPSHLSVVLFYMNQKGMTAKWRKIGIYLEILYTDLEMIEANHVGEDNRMMAMLNQWLKSGKATKDSLLHVLNMI